ncbi:MAG: TlpA family protein disulfide reductase [bacterium]|nr:TlpA family protein disulfide reductase [bacterium]
MNLKSVGGFMQPIGFSQMGKFTVTVLFSVLLAGATFSFVSMAVADKTLPNPFANKKMLTRLASGQVRNFKYPDKPLPPLVVSFFDEMGNKHKLAEWRGKTVLVNFWAPWCESCKRELPSLNRLRHRFKKQEFDIVIINIEENVKKNRAYLDKLKIKNISSMLDKDNAALKTFSAIGIPTSILVDCHGRELGRLKGSAVWDSDSAILLTKGMMRAAGCYDEEREIL